MAEDINTDVDQSLIAKRFRGFYPVIVDVETGGVNPKTDALLEIAFTMIGIDKNNKFVIKETAHNHITPFPKAKFDPKSMAIHNINPDHPFRFAVSEHDALSKAFQVIRKYKKAAGCKRAVLVGHNAWFDLHFLNAAIAREDIKRNPFHAFTCFDTASLSALLYGQTVLAQALKAANIEFDANEGHSAVYDANKTAELFCKMVNDTNWQW